MSSELEREIDSYLFYGGAFPNLARGMKEVPKPIKPIEVKHEGRPHRIPVIVGNKATLYRERRAEAIAEIEWFAPKNDKI